MTSITDALFARNHAYLCEPTTVADLLTPEAAINAAWQRYASGFSVGFDVFSGSSWSYQSRVSENAAQVSDTGPQKTFADNVHVMRPALNASGYLSDSSFLGGLLGLARSFDDKKKQLETWRDDGTRLIWFGPEQEIKTSVVISSLKFTRSKKGGVENWGVSVSLKEVSVQSAIYTTGYLPGGKGAGRAASSAKAASKAPAGKRGSSYLFSIGK